jgi:hypothetical protein
MEYTRLHLLDEERITDEENFFSFPISRHVNVCARKLDSGASYVYFVNHMENRVQSRAFHPTSPEKGMTMAGGKGEKAIRYAGKKRKSFATAKWHAQHRVCKAYDKNPYGASFGSYDTSDFVKLRAKAA